MRCRARAAAEADVSVRVWEVEAGGTVLAADVKRLLSGKLGISVAVSGAVYGDVTGATIGTLRGGTTSVDVDNVGEGGSVTGATIDELKNGNLFKYVNIR